MKYAFMSFSCPELTLSEMLALAARVGYDGIEPRLAAGHRHGIETIDQRGRACARSGSRWRMAPCPSPAWRPSCQYANPAKVAEKIDETKRCIDLAAAIGRTSLARVRRRPPRRREP